MSDPNVIPPARFQPYKDTFEVPDTQQAPAEPGPYAQLGMEPPTVAERMSDVYGRLTTSAAELNTVSDELGKPIPLIESALQQLHLGIEAWIMFYRETDPDNDRAHVRFIGYAKVKGKWGLAIKTLDGFYDDPSEELWLFGDAPRAYRVQAVDLLPDLIEHLLVEAEKTTAELKRKLASTNEVATALTKAAANKPAKK